MIAGTGREFITKDTHRGLGHEDGKRTNALEAGRCKIPRRKRWFKRLPTIECLSVDVRQRDLTKKHSRPSSFLTDNADRRSGKLV